MIKVKEAFTSGKAFIPFITAGDPDLDTTKELILAMDQNGADLIEIGIPFSDPVAEGPVIQEADLRALAGGATTDKIFEMVREVRPLCTCPLAFMTYMNPIFVYGTRRFMEKCSLCGVSAVIVPDVPYEEKQELYPFAKQYGIEVISLIAPTSQERIKTIAKDAEGFVYCVSSMGVTGVRSEITTDVGEMVRLVKSVKDIPCAVGFGISSPEQAKAMAEISDGVIVGSAIVKMAAQYGKDCAASVAAYVRKMKEAIS